MYTLQGGKERYVSLPRPSDGTTISFTKNELTVLVDRLLFRKERNNGVGRYLLGQLRLSRSWYPNRRTGVVDEYVSGGFSYTLPGTLSGFRVRPSFTFKDRFELVLFGDADALLSRLNGQERMVAALAATRAEREKRRKEPRQKRVKAKTLRSLPGTGLHWHFRNHNLRWDDAVHLLAKASRLSPDWVRRKLITSLDEREVASVRLEAGFVARIDLGYECRTVVDMSGTILDITGPVDVRTTDNNRSPTYRRLRALLKTHFDCVPRARVRAKMQRALRLCA